MTQYRKTTRSVADKQEAKFIPNVHNSITVQAEDNNKLLNVSCTLTLSSLYETYQKKPVSSDLWNIVVPPFSLLFLQFDRNSSDWTPLDPLHQMCHIPAAAMFYVNIQWRT